MSIRNPFFIAATAILVVLLAITGGIALWLRGSLPDYRGSIRLPGLVAPVNIIRDSNAIPHIFAARETDAYFALGFVHASDRLWQMDLMRRLAAGRLSEVFGPLALSSDKMMRTLGLHRLAAEAEEQLPPSVREALQAYADGVNAWLEHANKTLPPEFIVLQYRPEEWRPVDSVVWGKLMAWQLSGNMRGELLRARLSRGLPAPSVDELLPVGIGRDVETASIDLERGSSNPLIVDHLADLLGPDLDQPWASNVWVVGPERTGTGAPILANDPHLGLSVPIPWYLVRLESPKLAIRGASVPGVPFIALGHNRSIAWGLTNTGADVQDLLIADIDPEDPQTIVTDEGRVAITVLEEVISVKGEDDETLEVRSTPFGPVISDVLPDSQRGDEDAVLILAFTALTNEDPTAASLYAINHARDWSDMQQALADWSVPPVNVGYADIDGRFAFAVAGKIPIREAGEGVAPRPLSLRLGAWREFIAAQDLPAIVDPAEGWIGNANNDPAPPDYPYWLAASFEEGFRMARLDSLIEGEAAHTVDKSLDIQTDTVSLAALELLPLMMAMNPQNPAEADLFADLRAWDGSMERDRSEPLVFAYWARELTLALFEDDLAEAMPAYMSFRPTVLSRVLTDHQGWCDDVQTDAMETCLDMLRLSLRRALLLIEADHGTNRANWRWGSEHVASLKHPLFSRIPLIRWFGDASRQTDGGPFTLNRGDTPFRNNEQPFAHTHGAGYRGVFDLADLDKSRFIITTGPSGNPLSPFYDSMVDRWRDGETVSLAGSPDNLAQTGLGVLTLRPMP